MKWLRRSSTAQRVVIVIALGLVLALVGEYVATGGRGAGGGWYSYAPNTSVIWGSTAHYGPATLLAIWCAVIVAWAALSVAVLGLRPKEPRERDELTD